MKDEYVCNEFLESNLRFLKFIVNVFHLSYNCINYRSPDGKLTS